MESKRELFIAHVSSLLALRSKGSSKKKPKTSWSFSKNVSARRDLCSPGPPLSGPKVGTKPTSKMAAIGGYLTVQKNGIHVH